jgi:DNA-binding NarL/FixJ family response regulator
MIDSALIESFATDICSDAGIASFQQDAIGFFQRHFFGSAACFMLYRPGSDQIDSRFFELSNLSADTGALYCDTYGAMDPIADRISRYLAASRSARAARSDDVLPSERILFDSPFYAEFMRPRNLRHVLSVRLALAGRRLGRLNLYRPRGERGFSTQDAANASLLAPLVSVALERACQADLARIQERIIDELTAAVPRRAIVVLDREFRVTHLSKNAVAYLQAVAPAGYAATVGSGSSLPVSVAGRCRALSGSEGFVARGQDFAVLRAAAGELMKFTLIRAASPTASVGYFLDIRPHANGKGQDATFALSRREQEVVDMIACGLRNAEISDKLCISPYTVNNHLRSIYGKLGVTSRTQMLARLGERN